MEEGFWTVRVAPEIAADLERECREAERSLRGARRLERAAFELLVDRYRGFIMSVRSNEHPPPHFHVQCAAGEASFRLSDGALIVGNLQREARTVRAWYERNRELVIDAWNRSRPADCPVGPYHRPRNES
jgi:hypothetical protein